MNPGKIRNIILFVIYTYFIANSLFFATLLSCFNKITPEFCWELFLLLFCQAGLLCTFFSSSEIMFRIVATFALLIMNLLIIAYPVSLWWRKRTVFHAWLVAMASILMPEYIIFYIDNEDVSFARVMLAMNGGYAIAWLIEFAIHRYHKKRNRAADPKQVASAHSG